MSCIGRSGAPVSHMHRNISRCDRDPSRKWQRGAVPADANLLRHAMGTATPIGAGRDPPIASIASHHWAACLAHQPPSNQKSQAELQPDNLTAGLGGHVDWPGETGLRARRDWRGGRSMRQADADASAAAAAQSRWPAQATATANGRPGVGTRLSQPRQADADANATRPPVPSITSASECLVSSTAVHQNAPLPQR